MKIEHLGFLVALSLASPASAGSGMDQLPNGPGQVYGRGPATLYIPSERGRCFDKRLSATERLQHCDAALKSGHDTDEVQATMASILVESGHPELALPVYDRMLAADPDSSAALIGRCRLQALQGTDLDAAAQDCTKAASENAGDPAFLSAEGTLLFREGRLDEALKDFNSATRTRLKSPDAFFMRGLIEHRQGAAYGDGDMQTAVALDSNIAKFFAAYGIAP